jgi:hypothetical protein
MPLFDLLISLNFILGQSSFRDGIGLQHDDIPIAFSCSFQPFVLCFLKDTKNFVLSLDHMLSLLISLVMTCMHNCYVEFLTQKIRRNIPADRFFRGWQDHADPKGAFEC